MSPQNLKNVPNAIHFFSGKEFDMTVMTHFVVWKFFCKSRNDVFSKSFSDMTGEESRNPF